MCNFLQVFFVLRKKNSQITFLHIYHHAGMVVLSYIGTKFMPGRYSFTTKKTKKKKKKVMRCLIKRCHIISGGHGVFLGMINCFVHSVMYSYYFITNYNPEYKKKIWWKKHITQIQMVSRRNNASKKKKKTSFFKLSNKFLGLLKLKLKQNFTFFSFSSWQ